MVNVAYRNRVPGAMSIWFQGLGTLMSSRNFESILCLRSVEANLMFLYRVEKLGSS